MKNYLYGRISALKNGHFVTFSQIKSLIYKHSSDWSIAVAQREATSLQLVWYLLEKLHFPSLLTTWTSNQQLSVLRTKAFWEMQALSSGVIPHSWSCVNRNKTERDHLLILSDIYSDDKFHVFFLIGFIDFCKYLFILNLMQKHVSNKQQNGNAPKKHLFETFHR